MERAIETVEEIGGRYEFVTKDGDTVTLARVPASAKKDLATTAGILIDKFRLEAGEHTSRPDLSSFDVAAAGLAKLAEQS